MEDVIDRGTHCELIVRNRAREIVARATFDKHHKPTVASLKWNLHYHGYPRNVKHGKYLHQIIKEYRPGYEIDHIDGNKLNNLDSNLRYATRTENSRNLPLSKRNRSGCKGVWWDKANNAWQVKICVDRKQIFLGRFADYDQAVQVRHWAEQKYYGEFARKDV